MKNDKRIDFALWNYSDTTSKTTLQRHQKEIQEINWHHETWEKVIEIIRSCYSTPDPMHILNIESTFSIDGSILLAVNGYYKQAISLLRSWFENSMFALFFRDHPVEFGRWNLDEDPRSFRMNFSNDLLNYLFKFPTFEMFDREFSKGFKAKKDGFGFKNFRIWIETVYTELSAHIHGRGSYRSNLANIKVYMGEVKYYNKSNFEFWYMLYINVIQILIISFILYNPKLLNRHSAKRKDIIQCLHPSYANILKNKIRIKI